jgi:CRP-like cAMP-binding protein
MTSGEGASRVTATTLANHHFLRGMPRELVAELVPAARLVSMPAGRRIFEDGGIAQGFWLIRSGSVALDLQVPGEGQLVIETLGMGEVLGWSWQLPRYRWALGAVAVQPTEAFQFDGPAARALCDADPRLGYELTRRFLDVASNRLQATRNRLLDRYVPARPWP